jgi:hypothetical protein
MESDNKIRVDQEMFDFVQKFAQDRGVPMRDAAGSLLRMARSYHKAQTKQRTKRKAAKKNGAKS